MVTNPGLVSQAKANILIVDDTSANLTLLTQILLNQNYKVRVAPNGKMALQSVQASLPDLILLDIKMPEMDGYTVCRHLKSDEKTCDIPIIFISALDSAFDKVSAFTLGGVDYITKPFESVEVLARIEYQLRLRQFQLQLQAQNAQLQLLLTTTQAISEAADLDSALQVILAQICQTIGWDFGQAWIPNTEGTMLEYRQAWFAGEIGRQEFPEANHIIQLAPTEGLPGRVWVSQQVEWVEDISQQSSEALYPPDLITPVTIKGALGIPILFHETMPMSHTQVLAVLVFFQQQEKKPDEQSLTLIHAVASQLGSMIQRKKTEAALKQANSELERLANLDGLTQVANRRRFDHYLLEVWKQAQQHQKPLSLIMFDLDYFKLYNDYYGHQAGDDCLQQVARAADRALYYPTDLLARYGGEEFAAILPNTSLEDASAIAQRIALFVEHIQLPHPCSPVNPWVTLSLGISSLIPTQKDTPDHLIATADEALYEAKRQGRNRIICKAIKAKL
jgi:two-component system cell cycle response regulator